MKLHSFLTLLAAFALTTTLPVDAKADSSAKSSKTKKKKVKSKKKKDKADEKKSGKKGKKAKKEKNQKSQAFCPPVRLIPYKPVSADAKAKAVAELERRNIKPEAYMNRLSECVKGYSDSDTELVGLLSMAGADLGEKNWVEVLKHNGFAEGRLRRMVFFPGFDVNKADEKGKSMLESAAESRQMEKLQLMLAAPGANVKNPRLLEAALKESWRSPGWIEGANLLLGIPGIDTSAVPPILLAVMKNDEAELKRLLKEDGADVNVEMAGKATPLMWAAACGYHGCLKALLAAPGIDVNKEVGGDTALSVAAYHKQSAAVKMLLAADGIDVNKGSVLQRVTEDGDAACLAAILKAPGLDLSQTDIVHSIVDQQSIEYVDKDMLKVAVNAPGVKVGEKSLECLYNRRSFSEITRILLDAPQVDMGKLSPLSLAASAGDAERVKTLLADESIDINKGADNRSPLFFALYTGNNDIARMILQSPRLKLEVGNSQEVGIALSTGDDEIIELVLKKSPEKVLAGVWGSFSSLNCKNPEKCVKLVLDAVRKTGESPDKLQDAVFTAAQRGDARYLKALLAIPGIDVNKKNREDKTALMVACSHGHADCVKTLLEMPGIDITYEKKSHGTAFTMAAEHGATECAKLLVNRPGVNVNERNVLSHCAGIGCTDCVELLLKAPGIKVNNGEPLKRALNEGNVEIIKLLLEHPEVNKGCCPPLIQTMIGGNVEEIKKQIASAGADVNKADANGRTPMSWAIRLGQTEVLKELMAAKDIRFDAAEMARLAMKQGKTEIAQMMLTAPGVKVAQVDEYGVRLVDAAKQSGSAELMKVVLALPGADAGGFSPLELAIATDDAARMKSLLKARRQDANVSDCGMGWRPLALAAYMGSTECLKALLEMPGIDVNKPGYPAGYASHDTPALYCAALKNHPEAVKLLLAAPGIDVNADAPLAAAIEGNSLECLKLLLAAPGIDVKASRYHGGSALDYSCSPEMKQLLMKAAAR